MTMHFDLMNQSNLIRGEPLQIKFSCLSLDDKCKYYLASCDNGEIEAFDSAWLKEF